VKERPILFSAPMVRALLEGRKTQTRRVVKFRVTGPNPPQTLDFYDGDKWKGTCHEDGRSGNALKLCPYGVPGDRLWVRETWSMAKSCNVHEPFYRADGEASGRQTTLSYHEREARWRPSIFMPRWASRITLEVTDVRVERLQEISEADALAEGAKQHQDKDPDYGYAGWYRALWESINGPDSWAANPWVWVIEIKRVQP
jgi:hypothetical protein